MPDLEPLSINVTQIFSARVSQTPHLSALRYKRRGVWWVLTWSEWAQQSRQLANALVYQANCRGGDRIALVAPNGPEWAICDIAITSIGAISVPISPHLSPEQIAHIFRESECRGVILLADSQLNSVLTEILCAQKSSCVQFMIHNSPLLAARIHVPSVAEYLFSSCLKFGEQQMNTRQQDPKSEQDFALNSAQQVAKRVMSHQKMVAACSAFPEGISIDHHDEQLLVQPLAEAHAHQLLWQGIHTGAVTAFADATASIWDNLQDIGPTYLTGTADFFDQLYRDIVQQQQNKHVIEQTLFAWCLSTGQKAHQVRTQDVQVPLSLAAKFGIADALGFKQIRRRFGERLRFLLCQDATLSHEASEFFQMVGIPVVTDKA